MYALFRERGYVNADPNFRPHESKKHGFYKLQKNGTFYFAKFSKDDGERRSSIVTDIWWCHTIQNIRAGHSLPLRTPRIVEAGYNWYIAEWIDGRPSVQPTDDAARLDPHISTYAQCLAALDSIRPDWITTPPPTADNSTPHSRLSHKWDTWTQQPLAQGIITSDQLAKARALVDEYSPLVLPRFQHGDMTPWHLLQDAQGDWWLIDGEHASITKPRYYDLAYMYSRIFTRLHSPNHATQLANAFMQAAGLTINELYPALLPVMTSRAIGMHFDALNDLAVSDYRAEAQDLLSRCLSRKPERLFAPV